MHEGSREITRRGVRRGVYVLPALFTVGNLFCGFLSMDATVERQFDLAAGLLFLAAFMDSLDGRVARLAGATSPFGEQLDSLADVLSFGVAPAFLVYHWTLRSYDRLGLGVAFLFVVCGACRLARFNVQIGVVDKRYFVGLPIPAAAGALGGLIWALHEPPVPALGPVFLVVTVVLSYLMVSTFKYRSFKDIDVRSRSSVRLVPMVALGIGAIVLWKPETCLAGLSVGYALSAPVTRLFVFLASARRKTPPGAPA